MRTEYKYIHFEKVADKTKTSVWSCLNNHYGTELGRVKWYPQWRWYCFFQTVFAIYSDGCLDDISDFLKQVNQRHKDNKING